MGTLTEPSGFGKNLMSTSTISALESRIRTEISGPLQKLRSLTSAEGGPSGRTLLLHEALDSIEANARSIIVESLTVLLDDQAAGKGLIGQVFSSLLVLTAHPPRILSYNQEYTVSLRFLTGGSYFRSAKLSVQAFCVSGDEPVTNPRVSSMSTSYFTAEKEGLMSTVKFRITPKMIRGNRKLEGQNSIDSCQILFTVSTGFNGGGREGTFTTSTSTFPLKVVMAQEEPDDGDCGEDETGLWSRPMENRLWRITAGGREEPNNKKSLPVTLPFKALNDLIQVKFLEFTGRSLSESDMETVQQKFFSSEFLQKAKSDHELEISYENFMKPYLPLPESDEWKSGITYWGWFYHLAKFITNHLQFEDSEASPGTQKTSFWKEGYIVKGYMTTREAKLMLHDSPNWTFLLRFSNSIPNAVTIDWKEKGGILSYRGSEGELRLRNLVDRILDTPRWKYLYPDYTEKESLLLRFTRTVSNVPVPSPGQELSKSGYVTATLKSHLDLPDDLVQGDEPEGGERAPHSENKGESEQ